jgi:hypothetical protein
VRLLLGKSKSPANQTLPNEKQRFQPGFVKHNRDESQSVAGSRHQAEAAG